MKMCTCPVCEIEFEYKSNKKFCSRNCKQKARAKPHLLHPKGTTCSKCGFEAEHRCQLDLDHIDGDKKNNDPSNIQVLCANCHRLKTHMCGEHYPKAYRPLFNGV